MRRILAAALLFALAPSGQAGDIAGMQSMLPPWLDPRFDLNFSNDFLGRGGSVDDYRTQQFIISARLADRWQISLDHSLLTLHDPGSESRLDEMSASLGYRLFDRQNNGVFSRVAAGIGLRGIGDYAGERMQNGFHRLVGSAVDDLPYDDARDVAATAWLDAEYQAPFVERRNWSLGYWLRGRTLATSDGQLDSTIGTFVVATRGGFDAWAGLRQDWRSGYDEPVRRATASAEQDLAFVIGLRFGTLVLETVQQFDNDASYGQLRLLSLESSRASAAPPRFGLEAGFLLPDVHAHLAARMKSTWFAGEASGWGEAMVLALDFGEPQYASDPATYRETRQVGIALEWERPLSRTSDWLDAYFAVGAGWRQEQLVGAGALEGLASTTVDRPVLSGNVGLRFSASTFGEHWRYRIQTGISTWLPLGDRSVDFDGRKLKVLDPGIALSLGVTFDFG